MSTTALDSAQEAARTLREAIKDKAYRAYPLGGEAAAYLRWKRGVLTPASYRSYEGVLDKLARHFMDLELADFEPPVGVERLEEFLDFQCGERAAGTYNNYHAVLSDFFKWATLKDKLHGDPMRPIRRRKKRDVYREIFNEDLILKIMADGPSTEMVRRDRLALRLLLRYGLRKGALGAIQFKHFDATRKRLTVFTKGEKIRDMPIVSAEFWDDLAKLQFDLDATPEHYLMARRKQIWRGYEPDGSSRFLIKFYPEQPMSAHGLHSWWYGCLERASIVEVGVTSGKKMHMARHSAGQRILDKTHNLKAVQRQLGHASISTTGDTYTDWDADQQAETMMEVDV